MDETIMWAEVYGWILAGEVTDDVRFKAGANIIHSVTHNGKTYHAAVNGYADSLVYPMTLRFHLQTAPDTTPQTA